MAQNAGTTVIKLGRDALQEPRSSKFMRAVQKAVAGEYEVLGELGHGRNGTIVYLARELATRHLVALRFLPGDGTARDAGEMWLEVLRRLDESIPAADAACPRCGKTLHNWGRFCSQCGADLSGIAQGADRAGSEDELLRAVKEAARGRYEVLGQMSRTEGGGVVYFAKDLKSDRITALRLHKQTAADGGTEQYKLGVTQVIRSVAESLGAPDVAPTPPAPRPDVRLETALLRPSGGAPPAGVEPRAAARPASSLTIDGRTALLAGAGALVIVLLGVLIARSGPDDPPLDPTLERAAAGEPTVVAPVDSGDVQIGATLPTGAQVTVDGAPVAGTLIRLPVGSYTFRVTAPRHAASTQELTLTANQVVVWTPQLLPTGGAAGRAPPRRTTPAAPQSQPREPRETPQLATRPPTRAPTPVPPPATPLAQTAAPPPAPTAATPATVTSESPPITPGAASAATCASLFATLEWSRALAACGREANGGSTSAQRALATIYDRGLGTGQDFAQAARWYAKAAEGGDRIAQFRLGVLLRDGRGVRRDERASVEWLRRAADQGEAGAQATLGWAYEVGKGVKKDPAEALAWYVKAGAQGDVAAQLRAADWYARGHGAPRDDAEAARWLQRAAESGDAGAQYRLGLRYAQGQGVPKSDAEAVRWLGRAAAAGHAEARKELQRRRRP